MGQVRLDRRWRALGLTAALLAGAAACGGGSSADPTTTTTAAPTPTDPATSSTTTTAPMSDEDAVLAAYQTYWDVVFAASAPPTDGAQLSTVATGEALETALANVADRRAFGSAVRIPTPSQMEHDARVTGLDGDTAVIDDCFVDDSVLFNWETGEVLNDAVQTTRWESRLVRIDGDWYVTSNAALAGWDGAVACTG